MNSFYHRKKISRIILWLHLLLTVQSQAFAKQGETLAVDVKIRRQTICQVDAGIGLIRLDLNVGYKNLGRAPLVLFKQLDDITSTFSADSLDEFRKGAFTKRYTALIVSGQSRPLTEKEIERFVILDPQKAYHVRTNLELPVALPSPGKSTRASVLPPGTHLIGFTVRAWPNTSSTIADIANRWKNFGVVWSDDIRVGPIRVAIPSVSNAKKCP